MLGKLNLMNSSRGKQHRRALGVIAGAESPSICQITQYHTTFPFSVPGLMRCTAMLCSPGLWKSCS